MLPTRPGGRPAASHPAAPTDELDAASCQCQYGAMTETAKRLLDTFDSLPEQERREVAREILRRTALAEHPSLEDAELLALADEVFHALDHAEKPR